MNAYHTESHRHITDDTLECHSPMGSSRLRGANKNMARQIIPPYPNTIETRERAFNERDAFNANLATINNLRIEMGNRALIDQHGSNEQLEAMLLRKNQQIKKGLLTLPEIQGKDQSEVRNR